MFLIPSLVGAGIAVLAAGCSTLPAGRAYTLAKVDRRAFLVPADTLLKQQKDQDDLDRPAPNETIAIKLNTGYICYLESIKRAHVAVFSRVVVRNAGEAANGLVWEAVFTPNKDEKVNTVVNKDTLLPFRDVDVLPSIEYAAQEITVELRAISLKQDDNERIKNLINAAASAAAVAKPEAAATISVFQTALNFIVENRPDVVEFAYDFRITPGITPVQRYGVDKWSVQTEERYDPVIAPRVGTYALIKSEHPSRLNYPSEYLDFASHGLRYALAYILKFGTLGVLDWPMFAPKEDRYLWLLGRPFSVEYDSWAVPVWRDGYLIASDRGVRDLGDLAKGDWGRPGNRRTDTFRVVNNELWLDMGGTTPSQSVSTGDLRPYRDQSYLMLSILSPLDGAIPFDLLKQAAGQQKAIEELGIRTDWTSAEDQKKGLDAITNSYNAVVLQKQLRESCQRSLRKAKSEAEVGDAKRACNEDAKAAQDKLTGETQAAFAGHYKSWVDTEGQRRLTAIKRAARSEGTASIGTPPAVPGKRPRQP